MKPWHVFVIGLVIIVPTMALLGGFTYRDSHPQTSEPRVEWLQPQAEHIGNNIWRTDDHERGVSCYRSAQSGGNLSCVVLPRDK